MKAETLRKSILQMAIEGKLVPQNPSDEPASVLLERIRAEKQKLIKSGKIKIDLVVGPAMGGIIAAYEVARQLGLPAIFTERDENGIMVLRRGFEIQNGQNILIVEDVVTTGKSSMECATALEKIGGKITALTCVVDRRAADAGDIPWTFYPACKMEVSSWDASDCALCKQGIPVIKPGSRKI